MGGPTAPAPPPWPPPWKETKALLIKLGQNAGVPNPHTIYVVENPSLNPIYKDRTPEENCCYAIPVGHLTMFPFSIVHMVAKSIAFYTDQEAALEDARSRLRAK